MKQVTLEVRRGAELQEVPFAPSEGDVMRALDRLNGKDATMITLEDGDNKLFVAGGPEVFSVVAWLGDDRIYDLVGDPLASGTQNLVLGGQLTPVPARHCVPLERARAAALEFFGAGTVRISHGWEKQK